MKIIEIDCAPGFARPDVRLKQVLEGTGIEPKEPASCCFGEWDFKWTDDEISDEKWMEVKGEIFARLKDLYEHGQIRWGCVRKE